MVRHFAHLGWHRIEGNRRSAKRTKKPFVHISAVERYVLGGDGRLWQELGNRDQSVLVDHGVLNAGRIAFEATDAQHIYVLGSDHQLWADYAGRPMSGGDATGWSSGRR